MVEFIQLAEGDMDENTDVIQGTLDMLLLNMLSCAPLHGLGIRRRIEQLSLGVFKANPGSLFTALRRLEIAGMIASEWRRTENARQAKYYSVTHAGRKQLAADTKQWMRRTKAVERLLNTQG